MMRDYLKSEGPPRACPNNYEPAPATPDCPGCGHRHEIRHPPQFLVGCWLCTCQHGYACPCDKCRGERGEALRRKLVAFLGTLMEEAEVLEVSGSEKGRLIRAIVQRAARELEVARADQG